MSEKEQLDHFANEIDILVNRYREEYEMSYASVIGVLQMKMYLLCEEASERQDECE